MKRTVTATRVIATLMAMSTAVVVAEVATPADTIVFVDKGQSELVRTEGTDWKSTGGALVCGGTGNFLVAGKALGRAIFRSVPD